MARKNKTKPAMPDPDPPPPSRNTRRKTSAKPWVDGALPPQFAEQPGQAATLILPKNSPARMPMLARNSSPSIPPSVSSTQPLLPPHTDDTSLRNSHDLHVIGVTSSAKIESKVQTALSLIHRDEENNGNQHSGLSNEARPVLVVLVARAQAANKCISITEIVKREIQRIGKKQWYQYTCYWTRIEEHIPPKKAEVQSTSGGQAGQDDSDDDEGAFEKLDIAEARKIRSVPCLAIYLATAPVIMLKEAYGEQSTAITKAP